MLPDGECDSYAVTALADIVDSKKKKKKYIYRRPAAGRAGPRPISTGRRIPF